MIMCKFCNTKMFEREISYTENDNPICFDCEGNLTEEEIIEQEEMMEEN